MILDGNRYDVLQTHADVLQLLRMEAGSVCDVYGSPISIRLIRLTMQCHPSTQDTKTAVVALCLVCPILQLST